jgi:hypothetical protein
MLLFIFLTALRALRRLGRSDGHGGTNTSQAIPLDGADRLAPSGLEYHEDHDQPSHLPTFFCILLDARRRDHLADAAGTRCLLSLY